MRSRNLLSVITPGLAVVALCLSSASAQTVKEIFSFSTAHSSPAPLSMMIQGHDGNLYGTTSGLGSVFTDGTVFRATTTGEEGAIHTFDGSDGKIPAGVTLGTDGNLYGAAVNGGASDLGVLFKINTGGAYTILYSFGVGTDGITPPAPPIEGRDGNFYGTTGPGTGNAGTIYKYSSLGTFSTIFTFNSNDLQGSQLETSLLQGANGNLYGTAQLGGASNCGTIFEISTSGVLLYDYSFPCGTGGTYPAGQLIQASDGNFYGTTLEGGSTVANCGSRGCGIVFKMTKSGVVSVLHRFVGGGNDGSEPVAGLVQGTDGNLYGSTSLGGLAGVGVIYQITTGGAEKLVYSFVNRVGQHPQATLLQHTNGEFYGTTYQGGQYEEGTLYSFNMGLGPFVTFVLPAARVGRKAQILGQGLTGASGVTFNGVPAATFAVSTDTFMTAVVPEGATTGAVVVTTPAGPLSSNVSFRVLK
jgi:uncharacterized repeat protein (TIGR03803 family)